MIQFNVEGMSCNHCVQAVTRAIQALDSQARVQVDLADGKVQVDSRRDRDELARAIEEAGYSVKA